MTMRSKQWYTNTSRLPNSLVNNSIGVSPFDLVVKTRSNGETPMELFTKLFGNLLVFVYHCFDRIVIHGYLSGLSRPEHVVYFFRQVVGVAIVGKEVLSQRTKN